MIEPVETSSFHHLVFVTGPSGAVRSTACNALEDVGYEVIDNLPLSFIPRLIDGPDLSPHDLKAEIGLWFGRGKEARLAISVQSFSYKRGLPRGVDMVFDCRFLANPYSLAALREKDGREPAVAAHVESDPNFMLFFQKLQDIVLLLLPAQLQEGKAHLAIGFGCTGGQHRSVAVAEKLVKVLAEAGWQVSKRHRELERRGTSPTPDGISGETGVGRG